MTFSAGVVHILTPGGKVPRNETWEKETESTHFNTIISRHF